MSGDQRSWRAPLRADQTSGWGHRGPAPTRMHGGLPNAPRAAPTRADRDDHRGSRILLVLAVAFLVACLVLMVTAPSAGAPDQLGPYPTGDGDRVRVTP